MHVAISEQMAPDGLSFNGARRAVFPTQVPVKRLISLSAALRFIYKLGAFPFLEPLLDIVHALLVLDTAKPPIVFFESRAWVCSGCTVQRYLGHSQRHWGRLRQSATHIADMVEHLNGSCPAAINKECWVICSCGGTHSLHDALRCNFSRHIYHLDSNISKMGIQAYTKPGRRPSSLTKSETLAPSVHRPRTG